MGGDYGKQGNQAREKICEIKIMRNFNLAKLWPFAKIAKIRWRKKKSVLHFYYEQITNLLIYKHTVCMCAHVCVYVCVYVCSDLERCVDRIFTPLNKLFFSFV